MTQSHHDADRQYSLHPYTHLENHQKQGPFVISRGDGVYVYDDNNNRFLEGMSGLWCTSLGFNEQRLVDAAIKQFQTLPYSHLFSHRSTLPAIELSQKLVELAPEGIGKAYLVNSGSEAVDTAIKFAWYYQNARGKKNKKTFIARKRAYHGITVAAGSLTGLPYAQGGFDLPAIPVIHVGTPHAYREANNGESDEAFAKRLADELETAILDAGADTIAAFIAEPVMGAGGVLVPPADYFDRVQAILKKHDILFIADEVITGFGRTGEMWGCNTYNIKPDMITSAKQLSSAYQPIGAVLVTDQLYNAFEEYSTELGMFGTGNTYGGHPVASAVALETLKIYQERDIVNIVKQRSPHFLERLQALQNHPLVGNARGVGLIGAIELVKDKDTKEQYDPSEKMNAQVVAAAKDRGLVVRPTPGDSIAFCPPLIINDEEIDELFDTVTDALSAVKSA